MAAGYHLYILIQFIFDFKIYYWYFFYNAHVNHQNFFILWKKVVKKPAVGNKCTELFIF